MSARSTAIIGAVVSLLIIGAIASIAYYQLVIAPKIPAPTTTSSSVTSSKATSRCTSVTCTNVTIFQGAAIPPPGYNPNVVVLYGYDPAKVTLMLGKNNTVTWVNNDNTIHTATSTAGPQSFDSGNIPIGGSYSYTFGAAGTYRYHCIYHPWMIGAIVVESS